MKFKEPYKFEKNDEEEEDVPIMAAGEIEEEDVFVGENIPIEEEEEVEHKLDESLPIINFASCTNDELVYARLF